MNRLGLAIFLAITMLSCRKQDDLKPVLPPINDVPADAFPSIPVTVKVDQSQPGFYLSPAFEGLSYETALLAQNPEFLNENNTVLVQLIKNLGKGILRIGGDTSDEIPWADSEPEGSTSPVLTPAAIDRLSAFSRAIGWPVLFGLNLGKYDTLSAAHEALYVSNSLKTNLYALQSGNEPDVFGFHNLRTKGYAYPNFKPEWDGYYSAIKKVVPDVRFAGPDVTPFNPGWIGSFSDDEHANVRLMDGHYYNTGPASNPAITYHDILVQNPRLNGYLLQFSKISAHYRLPYRISECNSVFGSGKPGVSDVFASALWALDFMWTVAENKGQGVNFHGGGPRFAYTPIVGDSTGYSARPEYYAMLAFKYGSNESTVIPATFVNPRASNNCSAYAASGKDGSYTVTLINKEVAKGFAFTIQLTKTASSIKVSRLIAPSIDAKTGVKFGGSTVAADGTFLLPTVTPTTINSKSFVINVPAGSAAVVTIY